MFVLLELIAALYMYRKVKGHGQPQSRSHRQGYRDLVMGPSEREGMKEMFKCSFSHCVTAISLSSSQLPVFRGEAGKFELRHRSAEAC